MDKLLYKWAKLGPNGSFLHRKSRRGGPEENGRRHRGFLSYLYLGTLFYSKNLFFNNNSSISLFTKSHQLTIIYNAIKQFVIYNQSQRNKKNP